MRRAWARDVPAGTGEDPRQHAQQWQEGPHSQQGAPCALPAWQAMGVVDVKFACCASEARARA